MQQQGRELLHQVVMVANFLEEVIRAVEAAVAIVVQGLQQIPMPAVEVRLLPEAEAIQVMNILHLQILMVCLMKVFIQTVNLTLSMQHLIKLAADQALVIKPLMPAALMAGVGVWLLPFSQRSIGPDVVEEVLLERLNPELKLDDYRDEKVQLVLSEEKSDESVLLRLRFSPRVVILESADGIVRRIPLNQWQVGNLRRAIQEVIRHFQWRRTYRCPFVCRRHR